MKWNLLLGTVYVSPINSCVYNSVNERESTIGDGIWPYKCIALNIYYWGRYMCYNSCVYNSVNERESTIGDGIC